MEKLNKKLKQLISNNIQTKNLVAYGVHCGKSFNSELKLLNKLFKFEIPKHGKALEEVVASNRTSIQCFPDALKQVRNTID